MQYLHDVLDGNLYHQDDAETQSQGSARTKRSLPWQGFDDTHSAGSNHSQDLGGFGDLTEHSLPKDPSPGELPALPGDVYAMADFIGILDAWMEMQNEVVIGSGTFDSLRDKYTNLINKVKHLRDWMKQSSEKCALYSTFIFKIHKAGSDKLQENVRITDIRIDEAILEVDRMFNKERERYNYYHIAHRLVWRYATVLDWVLEYTYLTQVLGGNFRHPRIDYPELHNKAVELFDLIEHYNDTYRTEMEYLQKNYHEEAALYFQSWQEELLPMVEVILSSNKDLYDRFAELYSHGQYLDNLHEFSQDENNQVQETRDELRAWEEESRIASEEARMKKEASQVISTEEIIEYHTKALDIMNKKFDILRRQRNLLQSIHRKHLHNLQTRACNISSVLEEDIDYINNAVIRNEPTVDYLVELFARTANEEFIVASVQASCSFINNELECIDEQYSNMIEEEFNLKTQQSGFRNMATEIIRVEKKMVNIVNNFIHENNIKAIERAHLIKRLAAEKRDLIELLEDRPGLVPMALQKYEEQRSLASKVMLSMGIPEALFSPESHVNVSNTSSHAIGSRVSGTGGSGISKKAGNQNIMHVIVFEATVDRYREKFTSCFCEIYRHIFQKEMPETKVNFKVPELYDKYSESMKLDFEERMEEKIFKEAMHIEQLNQAQILTSSQGQTLKQTKSTAPHTSRTNDMQYEMSKESLARAKIDTEFSHLDLQARKKEMQREKDNGSGSNDKKTNSIKETATEPLDSTNKRKQGDNNKTGIPSPAKKQKRETDSKKKPEDSKKKPEDSKKKPEDSKKKPEDSKKKTEDSKKKTEDDKKKTEDDKKKTEDDKKKTEDEDDKKKKKKKKKKN